MKPGKVIGIDLGTTTSAMCYFEDGQVKVITGPGGEATWPSVVHYPDVTKTKRSTGSAAAKKGRLLPKQTVVQAKRLIGLKFSD